MRGTGVRAAGTRQESELEDDRRHRRAFVEPSSLDSPSGAKRNAKIGKIVHYGLRTTYTLHAIRRHSRLILSLSVLALALTLALALS
jgi:hypothetical protein